jgi:hypothetical protein
VKYDPNKIGLPPFLPYVFCENPAGLSIPEWVRSLVYAFDDNITFAPAVIAGNEETVAAYTLFDGVSTVTYRDHLYLPTDWIAQEYPARADLCRRIECWIQEIISA